MSLTIYYKSTRQVAAEEAEVIRSSAGRECRERYWLSCEPILFFQNLHLQDGMLMGGSKPNLTPHPDDKRAARSSGLPNGSPRDLLEVLARLSREHSIDWELTSDAGPVGWIRGGQIDPQAVKLMEALVELVSPDFSRNPLEGYGREADQLLRKICNLSTYREHCEWWEREIGWTCDNELALRKAQARYEEVLQRAKDNGWEIRG